jgi:hypothetical protein
MVTFKALRCKAAVLPIVVPLENLVSFSKSTNIMAVIRPIAAIEVKSIMLAVR